MIKPLTFLVLAIFICSLKTNGQTIILSQNFESITTPSLPAGWINTTTGTGDGWHTNRQYDLTASWYVPQHTTYVVVNDAEASGNFPSNLTSPSFSLSSATHPYLRFDVYGYLGQYYYERAYIQASVNGGTTWTTFDTIWTPISVWNTQFVNLSAYSGAASVKLRFVYTDNNLGVAFGAAIDNIQVFDAPTVGLSISSVSPYAGQDSSYNTTGNMVIFSGTVENTGSNTITAFDITYQQGINPPIIYNITGVSIPPFSSYHFQHPTGYTFPATSGNYPIKMWITLAGDTYHADDTIKTQLVCVSHMPHKRVLVESFEEMSCGYCVKGYAYTDSLEGSHTNDVCIVTAHGDILTHFNTETSDYTGFVSTASNSLAKYLAGVPSYIADREKFAQHMDSLFNDHDSRKNTYGFADINIGTLIVFGSSIIMPVTVIPAANMDGGYNLALILTEDSVHSSDGMYDQANYYSMGSLGYLAANGVVYSDSSNPIVASSMYYNHVARYTIPDMTIHPNGVPGSLPAHMLQDSAYSYTFTVPIPITSKKLRAIVTLIDTTNDQVLNSNESIYLPIIYNVGIQNVSQAADDISVYPNPAKGQFTIHTNSQFPTNFKVAIYDITGTLVYQYYLTENNSVISTQNLNPGVYQIILTDSKSVTVQKLVITK